VREAWRTAWANPYVKVAAALAAGYLLVRTFLAIQPAGSLFLAAFGLAYLANPVVEVLQARGVRRGFGVALVVIALLAITGLVWHFSLRAIGAALTEAEDGVALTESARAWFEELPANLERLLPDVVYEAVAGPLASLGDLLRQAASILSPYFEQIANTLYEVASATVFGAFQVVLVLILTVYVLYDFQRFGAALLSVVPIPYQDSVKGLASTLDEVMGGYIRGQLLIAALVGLMVFVGLTLIGLPLAGFIGLVAGVLNIVPFLGSVLPAVPAVIIALAGGWWQIILVVIVFVVANQIDNHVLTPMVLSKSTKLHPAVVILAVIGGFAAGGIVAAILAVPVVAFAKALYLRYYQTSAFYRGE